MIQSRLSQQDWRTMSLILALTVVGFALIGLLQVLSSTYSMRRQDFVMVIAWLFGATMTLAWTRRHEWFRKN